MKETLRQARIIAWKDFAQGAVDKACLSLAIGFLLVLAVYSASGFESSLILAQSSWAYLQILGGCMLSVAAGGGGMRDERNSGMMDALFVFGLQKSSFVLGKAAKPFAYGLGTSLFSVLVSQACFFFAQSRFFLYPLSIPYFGCMVAAIGFSSLLVVGLSIVASNETIYAAIAMILSIAPVVFLVLLTSAIPSSFPYFALAVATPIYLVLCVIAFLASRKCLETELCHSGKNR